MRNVFRLVSVLTPLLAAAGVLAAEGRVSEVHPLGVAEANVAHELVLGLLSPVGRAVLDEGHNTIIVLDTPERQQAVRDLLQNLQTPLRNVRIESRIVDRESGEAAKRGASGQLTVSAPGQVASGSVYFNVKESGTSKFRSADQFIVVTSGGEASIAVGKEIPFLGWFASLGERQGLIAGDIGWREVGSRLAVRATVIDGGRKVRLRVIPELEYFVGGSRKKKGRREEIAFAGAATELVVENGREVRLGGGEEHEEFYSRFLVGYDRQRRVRRVDLLVRPIVLGVPEGPAPK